MSNTICVKPDHWMNVFLYTHKFSRVNSIFDELSIEWFHGKLSGRKKNPLYCSHNDIKHDFILYVEFLKYNLRHIAFLFYIRKIVCTYSCLLSYGYQNKWILTDSSLTMVHFLLDRLYGMALPVCCGWHELKCKYWW